jgi:hypothetical protein
MVDYLNSKNNENRDVASLSFDEYVQNAKENCTELQKNVAFSHLSLDYSMEITKEELGLDDELINSLLEDFVAQIIRNLSTFRTLAQELLQQKSQGKATDPQPFYDLTHKNLGVARNLRIENARMILEKMMKETDFKKTLAYIDYLESCVILLKPEIAYKTFTAQ